MWYDLDHDHDYHYQYQYQYGKRREHGQDGGGKHKRVTTTNTITEARCCSTYYSELVLHIKWEAILVRVQNIYQGLNKTASTDASFLCSDVGVRHAGFGSTASAAGTRRLPPVHACTADFPIFQLSAPAVV